jgi:menaquinone-dependent protoporphyrinogen oxidase
MGRLHNDARRFLSARRDALVKIPVALFVPGPIEKRDQDWTGAQQELDKELARFPWLQPVACHIVGGTLDPKNPGFPFKPIPAMRKMPVSDARDWETIRKWAGDLGRTLRENQMSGSQALPVVSANGL